MASLIENLVSVLSEENSLYEKMIPLAERKTQIIVANDLESLQKLTEKEQALVNRIGVLEKQRAEVIINIGTVLGVKPEKLNFKNLIEALKGQPKEQQQLRELHDTLKRTTDRMVSLNNRNKDLINQSLEMIEFNLNYIKSTWMGPDTAQYSKSAAENDTQGFSNTRMFDAKQ